MRLLIMAALVSTLPAQVATAIPAPMQPLKILQGEWRVPGGWVDFGFRPSPAEMIGRIRPTGNFTPWRDIMTIFLEDGQVYADFVDSANRVTNYRLVESFGKRLVFSEDKPAPGKPIRTITYEAGPTPDSVRYVFRTGNNIADSGYMTRGAAVRPLSD